eukprot:scpid63819/ scgid12332/ 
MELKVLIVLTSCCLLLCGEMVSANLSAKDAVNGLASYLNNNNRSKTSDDDQDHSNVDETLEIMKSLLPQYPPERKASFYRFLFMLHVRTHYNRSFSAEQCRERLCEHGNKRYNCGASQSGSLVNLRHLSPSAEKGNCVSVTVRGSEQRRGDVCYAELWLNNSVVRALLKDTVPGQRGVLSVANDHATTTSTSRHRTGVNRLRFALNSTARLTHRWAKLNIADVTRHWPSDPDTDNRTLEVCWKSSEEDGSGDGDDDEEQLRQVKLKRLHTETLDFDSTIFVLSRSFFIFGVIPDEELTLPTRPKPKINPRSMRAKRDEDDSRHSS